MYNILAINPGSTSTKVALYEDDSCVFQHTIKHNHLELNTFDSIMEQEEYRRNALLSLLKEKGYSLSDLAAFVVRGGLLKPVKGGVYQIDEPIYNDLKSCKYGEHASNLGAVIVLPLSRETGIPAYTVDPVTTDEFHEVARYSGLKGIPRQSMSHALNMKAVARRIANRLGKAYNEIDLIIAHLGSGISVSAHRRGKMIDVNNANNEGPFSLERCGTLPAVALINLCYTGKYSEKEMVKLVTGQGGIYSYLGTKDFKEVENNIKEGDNKAKIVVEAMAYQVAKEIGAMATVLKGKVNRIVLTGGMAHAPLLTDLISEKISFIAPVRVLPGEEELEALALGALRVLKGEEEALRY